MRVFQFRPLHERRWPTLASRAGKKPEPTLEPSGLPSLTRTPPSVTLRNVMIDNFQDGSLDRYIRRIRAIPVLSREEEHELALKGQSGDEKALHGLVEANLRYVVAIALQYRRYGIRLGDLIAEGSMGLLVAVRKFDPHVGTRFVTYAGYWIRAYVLDAVVKSTTMVGGGSGPFRSKIFFRLRRERARLLTTISDPSERLEQLAARFETTTDKMDHLLRRLDARDVSLDGPVHDSSDTTLVETMAGSGLAQDHLYETAELERDVQRRLVDALGDLDARERLIVERRLLAEDQVSLAALGRELGVSRERARQLEARAKRKLRESLCDVVNAA